MSEDGGTTSSAVSVLGAGVSMVTYKVGGREYPMKTNRSCKVCMSPYRFEIEEAIVAGRAYQKIVDHLPDGHELNKRNVKDHFLNRHMPLEVSSTRAIIEQRAAAVGKSIEDSAEELVDGVSLAKVVVMKTFEAIADGTAIPGVRDGLRAMKLLSDLGEYDGGGDMDMVAMTEAFMIYHETAQATMDVDQFERFQTMLENNPALKALEARYNASHNDTIESEAEETE